MIPRLLLAVLDHLWQSTLLVLLVWLLTVMLRKNRAAVRHALWFAASLKFLIPFSVLVRLGIWLPWQTTARISPPTGISDLVNQVGQPFTLSAIVAPAAEPASSTNWFSLVLAVWIFGFVASLGCWFVRWWRIRRTIQHATPIPLDIRIKSMVCALQVEPGVFGVFRPVMLVPDGLVDRLSAAHLKAMVAHELCHVLRRDNLTAAIHTFVEALFWFHPIVWWIENRLLSEQERACDEEVLRLGNEPQIYAESILALCEFHLTSPLTSLSRMTGSNLKKRIEQIMRNRIPGRLSFAKGFLLAAAAVAVVGLPVVTGALYNTPLHTLPNPFERKAQQTSDSNERFEVVSIRPMDPNAPVGRGGRAPGNGGCGGGGPQINPGRVVFSNNKVFTLIAWAYGMECGDAYQFGLISGEPLWTRSEQFVIHATFPQNSDVAAETAGGPISPGGTLAKSPRVQAMLRNLLADRFKLVMHREQKQIPALELVIAKGGPKLAPGTDGAALRGIPIPPGAQDFRLGPNAGMDVFVELLKHLVRRPVIDRTGLTGRYQFFVYFVGIDESVPDSPYPPLFTAIQEQLGLRLQETKTVGDVLVIDHVEKPSMNR